MQVKSKILISLLILLLNGPCFVTAAIWSSKSRSTSIVTIGNESYYVHTVAAGETLYSLAKLYGVTEKEISDNNPQVAEGLQPMQVIKIKAKVVVSGISEKKQAKLFDQHTVNHGETAYSICKRYGLSLNTLVEDNLGIDPLTLSLGQRLNIRKTSVGDSEPHQILAQMESYRDATNSVSTGYQLHLVEKSETLYSLGKQYDIAPDELSKLNGLTDGLKAGMMLKIPTKEVVITEAPTVEESKTEAESEIRSIVKLRDYQSGEVINVAMLLPLQTGSNTHKNFLEFYQGALIALEDMKSSGVNIELNLYNTQRSVDAINEIVDSKAFEKTNLIIGPIYEDCFAPVLSFAEKHSVAVVSPLANMESISSPLLYQLSPEQSSKYDKLKEDLSPTKNLVVISMANNDADFEREITAVLPNNAKYFNYSKSSPVTALEALISGDKQNVFVVLSNNESSVDEFLARISSVQNNLLARSIKSESIKIIGTSRWLRFQNIDKNLYFKLGLNFVTSYHADRSNRIVMAFDKRYIAAFGVLPSLYSYRGYDAVKLFVSSMKQGGHGDLTNALNNSTTQLLQMPYRFIQSSRKKNNINREWALVGYKNDYTVEVW